MAKSFLPPIPEGLSAFVAKRHGVESVSWVLAHNGFGSHWAAKVQDATYEAHFNPTFQEWLLESEYWTKVGENWAYDSQQDISFDANGNCLD